MKVRICSTWKHLPFAAGGRTRPEILALYHQPIAVVLPASSGECAPSSSRNVARPFHGGQNTFANPGTEYALVRMTTRPRTIRRRRSADIHPPPLSTVVLCASRYSQTSFPIPSECGQAMGVRRPAGMVRQKNGDELGTLSLRGTDLFDKVGLSSRTSLSSLSKRSGPAKVAFFVSAAPAAVPYSINLFFEVTTERFLRRLRLHSLMTRAPDAIPNLFGNFPGRRTQWRPRENANSRLRYVGVAWLSSLP
jgi:hypothetical protein